MECSTKNLSTPPKQLSVRLNDTVKYNVQNTLCFIPAVSRMLISRCICSPKAMAPMLLPRKNIASKKTPSINPFLQCFFTIAAPSFPNFHTFVKIDCSHIVRSPAGISTFFFLIFTIFYVIQLFPYATDQFCGNARRDHLLYIL